MKKKENKSMKKLEKRNETERKRGKGKKNGKMWSRFDSGESTLSARSQEQGLMFMLDSRSERVHTGF